MNLFVADPEWGWWIILYFFLGGVAAGAYFVATLVDLFGSAHYRELARVGYWIAFPLICVCGILLTIDLERPERFWHMLFKSEIVQQARAEGWPATGGGWQTFSGAVLFKYWSPMSVGAWGLVLFGVCSGLCLVGSLWPDGRLSRWFRRSLFARLLQVIGCAAGCFIASYTGALATATNQPLWSDSNLIASLFLASSASTGIAAMMLLAHSRHDVDVESEPGLWRAESWALFLELVVFTAFLVLLGPLLRPLLFTTHGKIFVIGTALLAILLPLFLLSPLGKVVRQRAVTAAVFSLLGGLVLRYGLLTSAPEMLDQTNTLRGRFAADIESVRSFPDWPRLPPGYRLSPEEGRPPGGGPGADPGNRSADFKPRSKVFHEP